MSLFKKYLILSLCLSVWSACNPAMEDKIDLPAPSLAAFEVQLTNNPNRVRLVNKTADAFLFKWDLGNGTSKDSSVAEAYYPFKGTYVVTLTAFSKGGHHSVSQSVTIAQDDPAACTGNLLLLSACSRKTWKLAPEAGALQVGPDAAISTVWWGNSLADVNTRSCLFNDEYTFTSTGVFEFDNKGDFWADTDGNGVMTPANIAPSVGCNPATAMAVAYRAWSSNTHRFVATGNTLTVTGTGAFIGLYKVGNGAEVTTPQTTVTYTLKSITANRLVLLISFGGGYWQFTLVPK